MCKYLSVLFVGLTCVSFGQQVEDLDIYQEGTDLFVSFTITPKASYKELYDVILTSSVDGYDQPINIKNGQSEKVTPGERLVFTIDGKTEFRGFQGEISFSVTANLVFAPLEFIISKSGVKRGKTVLTSWSGGYLDDTYNLELIKDNIRVQSLGNNISENSISWVPSNEHRATKGYILRLTSNKDPNERIISEPFAVRRKVALGLKILPLLIGGGVVGVLTTGSDPDETINGGDNLPNPPDPPGGP